MNLNCVVSVVVRSVCSSIVRPNPWVVTGGEEGVGEEPIFARETDSTVKTEVEIHRQARSQTSDGEVNPQGS